MSLHLTSFLLYLFVGFSEWWLALRRTLACSRGERLVLVVIVFIENFLGLFVMSSFVRDNDWKMAVAYSVGGSLGAWAVVSKKTTENQSFSVQQG